MLAGVFFMRLLLLVASLINVSFIAAAQEPTPAISVCQLLREPGKYNTTTITLRGIYFVGGHGPYLQGDNCEGLVVAGGVRWPSLIWLGVDGRDFDQLGLSHSSFERHGKALADTGVLMERELSKLTEKERSQARRWVVTYRGRIETGVDFSAWVRRRADGSLFGAGFGPGPPGAPAELFIESVISVELEKLTTPGQPSQKSDPAR